MQDILSRHLEAGEVLAFGSHVVGNTKPYSDLNLAVIAPESLGFEKIARMREAFMESELPMRVDVLDWHALLASFRQAIQAASFRIWP